ncbi:MAG: site-specific integrase [Marinomonas sp.]|nr:MAG: site-specific integrase [Marinomonas sp.]
MSVELRTVLFEDGERFPVLVDKQTKVPHYWSTLFATIELRRYTQNTAKNVLRDIALLMLWEGMNNRNLVDEFCAGRFLTHEDIISIREHCAISSKSLNRSLKINSKAQTNIAVLYPSNIPKLAKVSAENLNIRISRVASYLGFLARVILRESSRINELQPQIDNMVKRLIAQKAKGVKKSTQNSIPKIPSKEVFEKLMAVVEVESADNPWKSESTRFRNWLMIKILYDTGMRSGEVLSLRIDRLDLYAEQPTISVTRTHNDPYDSRKNQPVAKTLERNIPISSSLADAISRYIEIRSKISGANKHPYLFVTQRKGASLGQPLSEAAFYGRVFKPIIEMMPEFFSGVSRHHLRHNFNERLSDRIDEINRIAKENPDVQAINEKQEIQIRQHLCGWKSEDSPAIYNQRHIHKVAREALLDDMNRQFGANDDPE